MNRRDRADSPSAALITDAPIRKNTQPIAARGSMSTAAISHTNSGQSLRIASIADLSKRLVVRTKPKCLAPRERRSTDQVFVGTKQ
jgi:hypothetical protein